MKLGELTVNRLGFGAMRVIDNGSIWGEPSDRAKALKVLRRALELGVNFFDTAESYGPHTSEILIAEALYPYPKVPLEVSLGALADMQREGKIRHVGVSNVTVKQLEQARKIAPVVSVQNRYNLGDRNSEDVLKACEKLGIAFLPWYPLGDGAVLRMQKLKDLARKLQVTPAQVAIAWLLAKSPVVLPIPGTSSVEHLEENVAAASLRLSEEDLRLL